MPALLDPVRHPVQDFFVLNLADVKLRDDMGTMEHPIFGLTSDPKRRKLVYENGDNILRLIPNQFGVPSIFDKDILIYCISQLVAKKNRGEAIGATVDFHAYDVLRATNRRTGGREYELLLASLRRLAGTLIETTIRSNDREQTNGFHLVESFGVVRTTPITGRMVSARLTLSDWMFRAIEQNDVLAIHPDYFRLRRPLDRRLYELARKFCGYQQCSQMSLEKLQMRIGSNSLLRRFRQNIRQVAKSNHLPEYTLTIDDDVVTFSRRPEFLAADQHKKDLQRRMGSRNGEKFITRDAMQKARVFAPEWDVEWLRKRFFEWRVSSKMEEPDNWNGAFLGWVKSFTKGKTPQQHQVMQQPLEPLGD